MTDIPLYVSCMFEMYIFRIPLVTSIGVVFLYVLSIQKQSRILETRKDNDHSPEIHYKYLETF